MDATAHVSISGPHCRYLAAYGSAGRHGPEALATLLPPRTDPDYLWILAELVRSDLEHHWLHGAPLPLEVYRKHFPELATDPTLAASLAAEESRLGKRFTPAPGRPAVTPPPLKTLDWTRVTPGTPAGRPPAISTQQRSLSDSLTNRSGEPSRSTQLGAETGRGLGHFPAVGERFLGFDLVEELGTGAFARVFLAEQVGLAGRPVALKVTTRPTREPQRLARLRHTNIVPIYSVHDDPPLQAVCMPFLGRRTLADLLSEYRSTGIFPTTAHSTAAMAQRTTVRSSPKSSPALPQPVALVHAEPPPPPAATPEAHLGSAIWLLTRMTEGLAHAHEAGILHLDLKPANVLLADDGQPLLLDFNLAIDIRAGDRERVGGTLPYMAPEQLDEYMHLGSPCLDQRTDLYALGIIAYELLTGQHPFRTDGGRPTPAEMARLRRAGPPYLRSVNPAVSPAVEAIVRMLLQPEPEQRYQTAGDLLTDLNRHQQNLPLRFAPDRSFWERVTKWRRRNPRLALYLLLGSAVLSSGGLGLAAVRADQVRTQTIAIEKARTVREELATLRVDLTSRDDPQARAAALQRGEEVLARYGLPEAADWSVRPAVRGLPPAERAALAEDLGELALLMAHAESLSGSSGSNTERALAWNRTAERCYVGHSLPAVLSEQRDRLTATTAEAAPATSRTDLYVRAVMRMAAGKYVEAIALLEELTSQDPAHFAGQFALARCRQELRDTARALERYLVAQALAPTDPRPAFHRGLIHLFHRRYSDAEAEFTGALKRAPGHAESYKHRAIARSARADYRGAVEDLNKALEHGASSIQVYHLRAAVYARLEDRAAAARDLEAAAQLTPTVPQDFMVRGGTRLKAGDTAGALADFARAAEANPQYLAAWQNQAHVLADILDQPVKALEAQDRAVASHPHFPLARSGRAVLLARLGRRADAHADAQKALLLSTDPEVTYQAACAYALTAAAEPADRSQALDLVRKALRDGYRDFRTLENDPDLEAIRHLPEFQAAVKAAKELVK